MITALEEMGHPQPKTGSPIETGNSAAHGVLNSKAHQKLSRSFDARCWWMKDRIDQGQLNLKWSPGKQNDADCFTKHHPPWHHCEQRCNCLQKLHAILKTVQRVSARGCVSSTRLPEAPRVTDDRTDASVNPCHPQNTQITIINAGGSNPVASLV